MGKWILFSADCAFVWLYWYIQSQNTDDMDYLSGLYIVQFDALITSIQVTK